MHINPTPSFNFPSIFEKHAVDGGSVEIVKAEPKGGYVVRTERVCLEEGEAEPVEMEIAYTLEGVHIGEPEWAAKLDSLGIKPELINPHHSTAFVGFSEKEEKWYGWSRGFCGFKVGDSVSFGDVAFKPRNENEWVAAAIHFWVADEEAAFHRAYWKDVPRDYAEDEVKPEHPETVRVLAIVRVRKGPEGQEMRNVITTPPPAEYTGRGAWTAKTLEDARQMAIDYHEGGS